MDQTKSRCRTRPSPWAVALAVLLPAAPRADCPATIDFSGAPAVIASDVQDDTTLRTKFDQRARATQAFSEQCILDFNDSCNRRDLGQAFHHRLFAYLASPDPAKRQQGIDYLRSVQRGDFGAMGTTAPLGDVCETTAEDVLTFLPDLATNLGRHGEGDVAMIALVTALYKYALPPDVTDHVLSLIDEDPTIGGVETVSFGLSTAAIGGICAAICAPACAGGPLSCAACMVPCAAALEGESVESPETENHLNNIYVAQYLANQKRFELGGNPKYDNSRNGYRAKMIARMRDFVRNDFVEYNAHPYQRYTMFALLALASFATDQAVKDAAKMALDYVSAKVAVSSNDLMRSTPFRRRDEPNHVCDDLYDGCADPQSQFFYMLTGLTDLFVSPPGGFAETFGWVAATDYRLDPLVLDLFVDRSHRKFYQFFHYGRVLQFDGFSDANDELYYGSPSFLLSAGGHAAHYAYTATVPFPIDTLPFVGGRHPGSAVDIGRTVPTTLMPTADPARSRVRNQMISFHEKGGENMCVAPGFACGLNPNVPAGYPGPVDAAAVTAAGLDPARWTVFDHGGPKNQYGYYVAVYRQEDFGFLEVYDTFVDAQGLGSVAAFMQRIAANNPGRTYSRSGTNTYKTADGTVLQFLVDARIVTINGVAPIRNRTNGDVVNFDGQGVVTITNPGLPGRSLTLNASIPPDHPTISVPGPIHFPDTCLGTTSYGTLDVCNVNSGAVDLLVYNVLAKNAQLTAVEPSSGYPLTVSHDFCYPLQVQYKPTVYGPFSSAFSIANSDPQQDPLRVDVTGKAPPGQVSVSGSGAFGNVCAGSNAQRRITVANTGTCPLRVTGFTLDDGAGGPCADFGTVNSPFPATIGPGSSLGVTIAFTPTSGGAKSCRAVVASDDPTTPSVSVALSATTPAVVLSVPSVAGFPPTVLQSVGTCTSQNPFPVVNNGQCPVAIASLTFGGAGATEYLTAGLPSLATPLQAGHVLGEGNLAVVFRPTVVPLTRADAATVAVTYEDDPITHHQRTDTSALCGEDVTRGARVLATNAVDGKPLAIVDKIQLTRLGSNRKSISVDNATSVRLQAPVSQTAPCASFSYHREWGGASNPVQLTAGDYQVTVSATVPSTGKKVSKTVSFTLGTCSFNPSIVVPF